MHLEELYAIIMNRQKNKPNDSYVASLFSEGKDQVIQKIGEEATEVIIAAKNKKKEEIISEMADLWFHTLILLAAFRITPEEIYSELDKRNQTFKKTIDRS